MKDENLLNEIKRVKELMPVNEGLGSDVLNYIKDYLKDTEIYKAITSLVDDNEDSENKSDKEPDMSGVDIKITHDYTGRAKNMVDRTIKEMEDMGIHNPYTQIGIYLYHNKLIKFSMKTKFIFGTPATEGDTSKVEMG